MSSISFLGKFPERAVKTCCLAMREGKLRPSYVKDVLKYKNVDVSPIEEFLASPDELIRLSAVKIIGYKGDTSKLVPLALVEESLVVLGEILAHVVKCKEKIEDLAVLLATKDTMVRDQVIEMFRKAKRSDCMFALLFEDDDSLASRIKKYIEEDEKHGE